MRNALVLALFASLVGGCTLFDSRSATDEFEGFFPARLDETLADIRSNLGAPDESWIGDCDCSGVVYSTRQGATTEITFRGLGERTAPAIEVTVAAPYPGLTPRGIRIGSSRRNVYDILGNPDDDIARNIEESTKSAAHPPRPDKYSDASATIVIWYDGGDHASRISIVRPGEPVTD